MTSANIFDHPVVSHSEWKLACREFLDKEKELTRLSDEVGRQRRELPWTRVEQPYVFDTHRGPVTLADLFHGRSQLAVYHFMFGPDWVEGCPGCSYVIDHANGALEHLGARDVSFVLVSRGPMDQLTAFKQRMGWKLPWVSYGRCDFNQDFGIIFTKEEVSSAVNAYNFNTTPPHGVENPGLSFFYKDENGVIFHTYSTFGRGLEALLGTYAILDRCPNGRNEDNLPAPMSWVRHHDKYQPNLPEVQSCCRAKSSQ